MKTQLLFLALAIGFVACTSPKEKQLRHIQALEGNDSTFSPQAIEELKNAYLNFANKYPDDDLASEYIYKAAQRCNVMAQHQQALDLFQRVIEAYPKSRVREEALFLKGYIYENSLNNLEKARECYMAFIASYPNSELAEDAKLAVRNLGKTPEEILQSFTEKGENEALQ